MSRKKKLTLAVGSVIVVAAVGIIVQFTIGDRHSVCLDSGDYRDLTGQTMPSTDPKTNFHSYVLEFSGNAPVSLDGQAVVNQIAAFYKSHSHKSILIKLAGVNQEPTTSTVASDRLSNLAGKLERGGVASSAITSSEPQFYEFDSNAGGIVTITIATGLECKQ